MICLPHDPQRGVVRQVGFYDLMSPDNGGMAHIQTILTQPFATNATKTAHFQKFYLTLHVAFKHTLYGFQHNRSLRYYNIQNTIDSYASTTIHSIVRSAGSGNTHKRTEANLGRGKKVAENFFLANDNKTAVSRLRINNKSGRHLLKKAHDEKQADR